ncbi:MAG: hypothetical protein HOD60_14635 [Candidatus Nitrosopelagicus sp.]|jgi:hypothetical protein|nr:hypothetical protein [Candidatus Nitrosopelagicus sp.]
MAFPPHEDYDPSFDKLNDKEKLKRRKEIWKQSTENNNVHENYNERYKDEYDRMSRLDKEEGVNLTPELQVAHMGNIQQRFILHELVSIRAVLEKIESKLDNKK